MQCDAVVSIEDVFENAACGFAIFRTAHILVQISHITLLDFRGKLKKEMEEETKVETPSILDMRKMKMIDIDDTDDTAMR